MSRLKPNLALFCLSVFVMGVDACGLGGTTLLAAYNVHANHLGSVEVITDGASSSVTQRSFFDPFGTTHHQQPTLVASFPAHALTGHEFDSESGLYYAKARYYDPVVGRFVSPDPALNDGCVSFHRAATQPQAANAYSYVENQPTVAIDPDGRASQRWWDNILGPLRRFRGKSLEDLQAFRRGVAARSLNQNGFAFVNHRDHEVMRHGAAIEATALRYLREHPGSLDPNNREDAFLSIAGIARWDPGGPFLPRETQRAVRDWVTETQTIVQGALSEGRVYVQQVNVDLGRRVPELHIDAEGQAFTATLSLRGPSTILFPRAARPFVEGSTSYTGPGTNPIAGVTSMWTAQNGAARVRGVPTVHGSPVNGGERVSLFVIFGWEP